MRPLMILRACVLGLVCTCSGAPAAVVPLYQRRSQWKDSAVLLSAVQVQGGATAAAWLPNADPRATRLLVVGSGAGALHILERDGTLLSSQPSGSDAGVSALVSYRLARNATVVVTGHTSGEVRLFLLRAPPGTDSGQGPAAYEGEEQLQRAELELVSVLSPGELLCSGMEEDENPESSLDMGLAATATGGSGSGSGSGRCAPITQLVVSGMRVASGPPALLTAMSAAGGVAVIKPGDRQDPSAVSVLARLPTSDSPIAAARAQHATLTLLGRDGIASLPAGTAGAAGATGAAPAPAPKPQWGTCAGLNGSAIVAAVFQEPLAHSGYALTWDGRLVSLVLGGTDGKKGCQVRSSARVPPQLTPAGSTRGSSAPPPRLSQLKGYLLLCMLHHLAVFNATEGPLSRRPPRLVLVQPLKEIAAGFLPAEWEGYAEGHGEGLGDGGSDPAGMLLGPGSQRELLWKGGPTGATDGKDDVTSESCAAGAGSSGEGSCAVSFPPALAQQQQQQLQLVLAADGGSGLVALGFGGGVVAVYESTMPEKAKPTPPAGAAFLQFLQPVAIIGVAGVVLWRARNKREAMAGSGGHINGLGDFERLLHGSTAGGGRLGRPGAFRKLNGGEDSDEDADAWPECLSPTAGLGGRSGPRPGSGSGSGRAAQRTTARSASQQAGLGAGGPQGLGGLGGERAEWLAASGGAAGGAAAEGDWGSDDEVEVGPVGGDVAAAVAAAARRPSLQPLVDYAPSPGPQVRAGRGEGAAAAGPEGPAAAGPGAAAGRVWGGEGEWGDAGDDGVDWCGAPMGVRSKGGGSTEALAQLRQQFEQFGVANNG